MDRIAHLALGSPDWVKTANFYKQVFGLKETERKYEPGAGDNPPDKLLRNLYLSDGHMNLTICNTAGGGTPPVPGMYHMGFLVDYMDETRERMEAAGGRLIHTALRVRGSHDEFKYRGPQGVSIDLSQRGWGVESAKGVSSKFQHLALGTPDVVKTANFYKNVFGLLETEREYEEGGGDNPPDEMVRRLYLWDGQVNLTICKVRTVGMYHFGFVVDNAAETRKRLEAAGATQITSRPRSAPGEGRLERHFEDKYRGPEGVAIDVASRGQGWDPLSRQRRFANSTGGA